MVINFQVRPGCLTVYKAALMIINYFDFPSAALDQWAAAAPARWFGSDTE